MRKGKGYEEWVKQAKYDLETAKAMFKSRRYIYVVFMSHLSIEKILKALFLKRLKKFPPKTHNLLYLVEKIGLDIPEKLYNFIFMLNRVSVPTRYPEDLSKMLKEFNKRRAEKILKNTEEVFLWIKEKLKK